MCSLLDSRITMELYKFCVIRIDDMMMRLQSQEPRLTVRGGREQRYQMQCWRWDQHKSRIRTPTSTHRMAPSTTQKLLQTVQLLELRKPKSAYLRRSLCRNFLKDHSVFQFLIFRWWAEINPKILSKHKHLHALKLLHFTGQVTAVTLV